MIKQYFFRTQITLCLFNFTLQFIYSQSTVFAPVGAVWTYNTYNEGGIKPYGADQYRYVVTKDTLINGWNARVVQGEIWTTGTFVPSAVMTRYVSTIGDKVYYWVDTAFVLLYDFNAQPGDTIYSAVDHPFPFPNSCSEPPGIYLNFGYIIDSLGNIEVDGEILRTQYVHKIDSPFANWNILGLFTGQSNIPVIERIGNPYLGTWFGGNILCTQEGSPAAMRCYKDSEIYFEGNTQGLSCDSVVAAFFPENINFFITPNPFSDEVHISIPTLPYKNLQFSLFDMAGQLIMMKQLNEGENMIHTGELPVGFYFWKLKSEYLILGCGKLINRKP